MSRDILQELDAKKLGIIERAFRYVDEQDLDVRGRLMPQNEVYDLKGVFDCNRWMEQYVYDMIIVACEVLRDGGVNHTVYIVNTIGGRGTDSIGFSCPDDETLGIAMNRTLSARLILKFASRLAPEERERYLQKFRNNGLEEYL